jgi:hypothetical protein
VLGLLIGDGELVIREARLLAAHQPHHGLQLRGHDPRKGPAFESLLGLTTKEIGEKPFIELSLRCRINDIMNLSMN